MTRFTSVSRHISLTSCSSRYPNRYAGLQQRNGRKTLTTVQGIPSKYNHSKILKAMKKEFACNGTVVKPEVDSGEEDSPAPVAKNHGDVLQLQGDQRVAAKQFLIDSGIVAQKEAKDLIVV